VQTASNQQIFDLDCNDVIFDDDNQYVDSLL
jgi:hypothetical protein